MDYDDDERYLNVMQMHADTDNKTADTAYKQGLLKYEPWKVVVSAMVAGAALMGGLTALLSYVGRGH